jgi:endonuclease III
MKSEEKTNSSKSIIEDESIGKIRDILFGNNISEIDKRFNSVEQNLQEMITTLKDEIQKKLHSFDDYFKSEISTVLDQLKKEQATRNQAVDKLNKELEKVNQAIEAGNDEMKANIRDVRAKMMDHYKENADSISALDKELKKLISKEVNQLTDSKVDRKALAVMLSDVALKLSESKE